MPRPKGRLSLPPPPPPPAVKHNDRGRLSMFKVKRREGGGRRAPKRDQR